jgi:chromosome segregation ATPase
VDIETIIALVSTAIAVGALYVNWRTSQSGAAKIEAEIGKLAAEKESIEVSAARGALEAVKEYAQDLKGQVEKLERDLAAVRSELAHERQLRHELERKLDTVIAFVRVHDDALYRRMIAQLDTGAETQGG